MKIIGLIQGEINQAGELTNPDYVGGAVVMLTEGEMSIIASLQRAWDNAPFVLSSRSNNFGTDDRKMDSAFLAVKIFTEAKFAVNELEDMVKSLNNILVKEAEKEKTRCHQ